MHPHVAAGGICAILLFAGVAFAGLDTASHDDHETHHAVAMRGGHGAGAHDWRGGTGTIPENASALETRDVIEIGGDSAFNPANGVRAGTGTFDDPFIISGWDVYVIYIRDTTKAFEIRENRVNDILVLDWTGPGGYVHHNHISNLRTNRNVQRTGDPSASVIEHNTILRVEELRHFDGVLRNNTIGGAPIPTGGLELPLLGGAMPNRVRALLGSVSTPGGGDGIALNIAGLNGAGIHDNEIIGGVDMKIHGHHHSDARGGHSHNHGQPDAEQAEDHVEDHQVRYVDFLFYNNTIRDNGFGLRYNDLAHAGDDRTATSEQEPDLEKPHVHHTRVTLWNNVVNGSTLRIAVLNADDDRHLPGQTAELIILQNRILAPSAGDGLVVQDVSDARVIVRENVVERGSAQVAGASGIMLQRFRNATIELTANQVGAYKYGIRAASFDSVTTWRLERNAASEAEHPVYWDDSVPNSPEQGEARSSHEHEHAGAEHWASLHPGAAGRPVPLSFKGVGREHP